VAGEAVAAEWARRTESALKQALGLAVPFARVDVTPIRDIWHLKNVVKYIFTQDTHHGFHHDRLREASSLPDTLGWRTHGVEIARRLKEQLPRLSRAELLEMIGM